MQITSLGQAEKLAAVLSPYQRDRLEKNILELEHVRQNLVELGMERMAILVQRAIEAGEAA